MTVANSAEGDLLIVDLTVNPHRVTDIISHPLPSQLALLFSNRFPLSSLRSFFKDKGVSLYSIGNIVLVVIYNQPTPSISRKADVIASLFSLSFFFFSDNDVNALVETIRTCLRNGGVFIGTTIDGERTRALLTESSPFVITSKGGVNGYLKWADNEKVEIFLKDTILANVDSEDQGRQIESLVDFDRLVKQLERHCIFLEASEFFSPDPSFSVSEGRLNSLYRTFVFRKRESCDPLFDRMRAEDAAHHTILSFLWRQLSLPESEECRLLFKELCHYTGDIVNIDFPVGEPTVFQAIPRNDSLFEMGYFGINPYVNRFPHFARTYGLFDIDNRPSIITEYRETTPIVDVLGGSPDPALIRSILLQVYYSLRELTVPYQFGLPTLSSSPLTEITYSNGVTVSVVDGWVVQWALQDKGINSIESINLSELLGRDYPGTLSEINAPLVKTPLVSTIFKEPYRHIRGLDNLGNSCYLNAAIQVLASLPPLSEFLCHHGLSSAKKTELVETFSTLLCGLAIQSSGASLTSSVAAFKKQLGKRDARYNGKAQQDAAECLRTIIDSLHTDLKGSMLSSLFEGRLLNVLTCETCHSVRKQFDPMWSVEMEVMDGTQPLTTLRDILKLFSKEEMVEGVVCEVCKSKTAHRKKLSIFTFPNVLVISWKRFGYRADGAPQKLTHPISYPLSFQVKNVEGETVQYKLASVINHLGSVNNGHYMATIRANGGWWRCNDEKVDEISEPSVKNDLTTPYVLVFHKV